MQKDFGTADKLCREKTRKANAQLEISLDSGVKDN